MSRPRSIAAVLQAAREAGVDRLDAHALLGTLLGQTRSWLLAHDDSPLSEEQATQMNHWIARRATGEPLAYLLGQKEFHGLMLTVSPDVLVPRPDTETLVDWALDLLRGPLASVPRPAVLDLGTGSGAIALAIKHRQPSADVWGLDASEAALDVARHNAERLGIDLRLLHGNWWQGISPRRYQLAVSNPPYIAGDDPHLAALQHEPRKALTPEGDGLASLREIIREAPAHLEPGGWLLLEHGYDQAASVAGLLRAGGFSEVGTRQDLAGQTRCTGGCCI